MLYLAYTHADSFEDAVLANVNVGGENCHRGAALVRARVRRPAAAADRASRRAAAHGGVRGPSCKRQGLP